MKIVVIGGGGLLGKKLVTRLRERGHEAVAASPSSGVNGVTGAGLAEVMIDAEVVVDVTNSPSFEDAAVLEFFEKSSRNLLAAEADAGVGHHVLVSIVGCDRVPDSGYLRAKVAQEKLIQSGGIPFTILRATQFFEFIATITAQFPTDGQTVRVPSVFFQPILSDDVVAALVDVTLGAPVNGIIDLAGPERFRFDEIIRQFLSATQDTRQVVTDMHARTLAQNWTSNPSFREATRVLERHASRSGSATLQLRSNQRQSSNHGRDQKTLEAAVEELSPKAVAYRFKGQVNLWLTLASKNLAPI